jgi:hypothetical protein
MQQRTDPRRSLAAQTGPVPGDDEQNELAGPTVSVLWMDDQAVADFLDLVDHRVELARAQAHAAAVRRGSSRPAASESPNLTAPTNPVNAYVD